jgi:hypothetical protein
MWRAVTFIFFLALLSEVGTAQVKSSHLEELLNALSDQSYKVRLQATLMLAKIKDRRAVPALIHALSDGSPLVRGMAAHALGVIGDSRALAPLKERRSDRDALVRKRVRVAIDQIKKQQASAPKKSMIILLRLASVGDNTKKGKALVPTLRRLWSERLESDPRVALASELHPVAGQRAYELTTSILKITSERRGEFLESTCNVNLVLGDHKGSIVMMTNGEATVQVMARSQRPGQEKEVILDALGEAVGSVHANLLRFLGIP